MNLKEIYQVFPTKQDSLEYLEVIRWNGSPVCPYCGSNKKSGLPNELRYHCNKCNSSYSVTTGTLFNKTKCDLQKWFLLIDNMISSKYSSVREIAEEILVTKDTAWLMVQKIEKAKSDNLEFLLRIISYKTFMQ